MNLEPEIAAATNPILDFLQASSPGLLAIVAIIVAFNLVIGIFKKSSL